MATSLARQLAAVAPGGAPHGGVASLLFEPAAARALDVAGVHGMGLNGVLELVTSSRAPYLAALPDGLFSEARVSFDRDTASGEANAALNAELSWALRALSCHLTSKSAQKASDEVFQRLLC
ncbi:hypothetical protein EON67_05495 [archaeon]|nr:MAG: hypothetical protein EON67_05495 [archaeon]